MSIPVDTADLARAFADFGSAYLITVGSDGRPKAVSADPVVDGDTVVVVDAGRGSLRNVAGNPAVTLVFPPAEARGFTLLVDGTGAADGPAGADLRIVPSGAVLHRPGRHADGPPPPPSAGERGDACRRDGAPAVLPAVLPA